MSGVYFERGFERAFGTWPLTGDACRAAIASALEVGYRAIDTAKMYGNEADVGRALAESGLTREALFVTTKVHPDDFAAERFHDAVRRSLDDLRLERIDVLLLHWPPLGGDVRPVLERLAEARERGLAAHIGVSNYTVAMLQEAKAVLGEVAVDQVEFHPLLNQDALQRGADALGVTLSGYATLAKGAVTQEPLLAEIGAGYGKSAGQVALRWILQKGVAVTTMSTKPANIRANFEVMDFTLSSVDMARIDRLRGRGLRTVDTPRVRWAPAWD